MRFVACVLLLAMAGAYAAVPPGEPRIEEIPDREISVSGATYKASHIRREYKFDGTATWVTTIAVVTIDGAQWKVRLTSPRSGEKHISLSVWPAGETLANPSISILQEESGKFWVISEDYIIIWKPDDDHALLHKKNEYGNPKYVGDAEADQRATKVANRAKELLARMGALLEVTVDQDAVDKMDKSLKKICP